MASLTAYRGLQVLTPDPIGDGGLAIQNDLKALVDWSPKSVWAQSADPTIDDDETEDFFPGSIWFRTNTTPPKLFVCRSSATDAAVWKQVLLQVAGPVATPIATKTTGYPITGSDSVILADATTAALNVTLPTAVGISGRQYTIKRINGGANNVTFNTTSSQTIDGVTTKVLNAQYASVTVVSDGANWMIV